MKKLFLDCEFNGFGGDLISIALVGDEDEWYEVIEQKHPPCEWVENNVMPILFKTPQSKNHVRESLFRFLSKFDQVNIIADWPEDIRHICELMIVGPGVCINTPPVLMFQICRHLEFKSTIPHNALEDAKALEKAYY